MRLHPDSTLNVVSGGWGWVQGYIYNLLCLGTNHFRVFTITHHSSLLFIMECAGFSSHIHVCDVTLIGDSINLYCCIHREMSGIECKAHPLRIQICRINVIFHLGLPHINLDTTLQCITGFS